MKRTKIVCTIGPSCDDETIITKMTEAGMNVARLNFSHGTHAEQKDRIERVKAVRDRLGVALPLMLDTKGPEYRIGVFRDHRISLKENETFILTTEKIIGDENRVSVNNKNLLPELRPGDVILLNDGLVKLSVKEKTDTDLICTTLIGGEISDSKSMSFPGKILHRDYLSEADKKDLLFGIAEDVDYVAASFVSDAEDILALRRFLDENGGNDIGIIAKIENRAGVDHADEILNCCDGLMVARGDLGVEIPYAELPAIQKRLLAAAREKGGITITATEMLESMISRPRPTRAEISDVANAVFDGSDCVMLSGETAAGKYPVEAVEAMSDIIGEAEKSIDYAAEFETSSFSFRNSSDALAHAACQLGVNTDAVAIVATTETGRTAGQVCRFRPPMKIIGLTSKRKTFHKLALGWNILPIKAEEQDHADALFREALNRAKEVFPRETEGTVIITGGLLCGERSSSDLIKITHL